MAAAPIRSVCSACATGLVLTAAIVAGVARADVLVNDRIGDPAGASQCEPRVTQVFNVNTAGEMVVVAWSNFAVSRTQNRIRFDVAQVPLDGGPYTFTFVNDGVPTPPAGYVWSTDPVIHGQPNDLDGIFYVAGRVRTPTDPPTIGLGFARGIVTSPNSVSFDHVSLVANFGTGDPTISFFAVTAMNVHPADGSIYLLFAPDAAFDDQRNVYFVRSTDGGVSWSPPTRVSSDSTSMTGAPSIVCGKTAGDVTFFWQQNDANPAYLDVMSRHSTNSGVTLGPPTLVMQHPVSFQFSPNRATPFRPVVEMDRSGSGFDGTVVCASAISLDLTHDTFPDVASTMSVSEVEPNNTSATATLVFGPGDVVRGTVAATSDTDYYAFDLAQGQEVNALADSMPLYTGGKQITLSWVGTDGHSMLTQANPTGSGSIGFTAPVAARYYLRVTAFYAPGGYRLRTVSGTPTAPGANDQHDVALSRLAPGGAWTGTQLIAPPDPIGYDDNCIALTSCADGGLFASYDDYSVLPGRALSRRVIRRSNDGGATWSLPVTMSSANTDWAVTAGFDLGSADMATDGVRMYSVWTDGRNGDPDIYFRFIYRRIFVVENTPLEMSAHPGQIVDVVRHVQNADSLESFGVRMVPQNDAGWTLAPTTATLAPAETAPLDCSFQVPADATPGDVNITVFYRSVDQPNATFGIANLLLHVTASTGVPPDGEAKLDLAAANPLRGRGEVRYSLAHAGLAQVAVYGLDGRRVRTLVDGGRAAGWQTVVWDGTDPNGAAVAPGAYFVQLRAEGRSLVRRFVFLR